MTRLNKRRQLLERLLRLEEHDVMLIKLEYRQARQALLQMISNVDVANRAVFESERLIRTDLDGQAALSIDALQGRRRHLALQRAQLQAHETRRAHVVALIEKIGDHLMNKQVRLNKLRGLIGDVDRQRRQETEKRLGKENDERWIQSRGRKR